MLDNRFYVYQYVNEDGTPYYIGKGTGDRIRVSHGGLMVPPKERRIIIKDNLTNDEAKQLEKELITMYKRKLDGGILENIKINQWACRVGWQHSLETKEKISKGNLGKVRSEEAKINYSKPKSAEHKEKIRQANIGRPDDGRNKKAAKTVAYRIATDKEYAEKYWNNKKKMSEERKGKPWSEARRQAHELKSVKG